MRMKIVFVIFTVLTLCGCSPDIYKAIQSSRTTKMFGKINAQSTIATVATFHEKTFFFNLGRNAHFDKHDFKLHSLPIFNMNQYAEKSVNQTLRKYGHMNVVDLPRAEKQHSPLYEKEIFSSSSKLNDTTIRYLKYVIDNHKVDYIVIVRPQDYEHKVKRANVLTRIHLPNNGVIGPEQSIFSRAHVYGAYQMVVVDTKHWRVLGRTAGAFETPVNIELVNNDFEVIPNKTIASVCKSFEFGVYEEMYHAAIKIGLIEPSAC